MEGYCREGQDSFRVVAPQKKKRYICMYINSSVCVISYPFYMQVFIEKKGVQSHKQMNCKTQEYKFTLICYIYFDTILIISVIMRDPVPFSRGLRKSSHSKQ